MRDKEDEARIKAYMAAKMKHIKTYNECMNLADGLDVEKFAELVRADEREKVAHEAMDRMVAENQRLGLYDTHNCKTHPDAPHGFDRNASHSADRYVCECEGWEPVDNAYTKLDTSDRVLHKEWVGLTDEEVGTLTVFDGLHHIETPLLADFIRATEAKLKEKNNG